MGGVTKQPVPPLELERRFAIYETGVPSLSDIELAKELRYLRFWTPAAINGGSPDAGLYQRALAVVEAEKARRAP